jgi:hypothetical protein
MTARQDVDTTDHMFKVRTYNVLMRMYPSVALGHKILLPRHEAGTSVGAQNFISRGLEGAVNVVYHKSAEETRRSVLKYKTSLICLLSPGDLFFQASSAPISSIIQSVRHLL